MLCKRLVSVKSCFYDSSCKMEIQVHCIHNLKACIFPECFYISTFKKIKQNESNSHTGGTWVLCCSSCLRTQNISIHQNGLIFLFSGSGGGMEGAYLRCQKWRIGFDAWKESSAQIKRSTNMAAVRPGLLPSYTVCFHIGETAIGALICTPAYGKQITGLAR